MQSVMEHSANMLVRSQVIIESQWILSIEIRIEIQMVSFTEQYIWKLEGYVT